MAEMKTQKNATSPDSFLNTIKEDKKREDAFAIIQLMKKASKCDPKMWGTAIIGFGDTTYTLSNGKKNPWFMIGFSPRKQNFALYLTGVKSEKYYSILEKLDNHSTSREDNKGCLYIKKLADIDTKLLQELFENHIKNYKST